MYLSNYSVGVYNNSKIHYHRYLTRINRFMSHWTVRQNGELFTIL